MLHFMISSLLLVQNVLCSILPIGYSSVPYSSSYISRSFIQHDPTIRNGVGFAEYGPPNTPAKVQSNYNVPVPPNAGPTNSAQSPPTPNVISAFDVITPGAYGPPLTNSIGGFSQYGPALNEPAYPNIPEQYKFGYIVVDPSTGDFKSQQEVNVDGLVQGQFSFLQPDGLIRNVFYTADDQNGFNAVVKTYPAAQPAPYPAPYPPFRSRGDGEAKQDPCKRLISKLNKLGVIKPVEIINSTDNANISKTEPDPPVNVTLNGEEQKNLSDNKNGTDVIESNNSTLTVVVETNNTISEPKTETNTTTIEVEGEKLSLADVLECAFYQRPSCLSCFITNDLK